MVSYYMASEANGLVLLIYLDNYFFHVKVLVSHHHEHASKNLI